MKAHREAYGPYTESGMTTPSEEDRTDRADTKPDARSSDLAQPTPRAPVRMPRNIPILDQDFEDTDPGDNVSGRWFEP